MSKLEQQVESTAEKLGIRNAYLKQILREQLGEFAKEAFHAGYRRMGWEEGITWSTDKDKRESPEFPQWLNNDYESSGKR